MNWIAFDVYYSDVDALLLEAVRPAQIRGWTASGRAFWQRGHVGGPHVRLCFEAAGGDVPRLSGMVRETVGAYVDARPSPPAPGYSPEAARALLAMENRAGAADINVAYRNNVVESTPFAPPSEGPMPPALGTLLESFYGDAEHTAYAAIESGDKQAAAFRMFLLFCLVSRGSYRAAAACFRAHWERFSLNKPPDAVARIEALYPPQAESVAAMLQRVEGAWAAGALGGDPVLAAFGPLMGSYLDRAGSVVAGGGTLRRTSIPVRSTPREVESISLRPTWAARCST